ncbi:hypothetical protein [Ktedonospora formicarum]|uniref:hypothetical protein n=1 Tax=Ktedonospora formicarum TaxID=2778364 RepID=UPI001C68E0D2|nr:hypothetical protein [Ktedonospora formicarum]
MPRTPLHTISWSQDHAWYELVSPNQVFVPGDEEAWQAWLLGHDSFAFQGRAGRLNVYKEARPRGGQYWYAYHTTGKRTDKRYLGHTTKLTFARLEEVAAGLTQGKPFQKTESPLGGTPECSVPPQCSQRGRPLHLFLRVRNRCSTSPSCSRNCARRVYPRGVSRESICWSA